MNILFLTLVHFNSLQEHNLYTDLLREFVKNGHSVYAISPIEKRENKKTYLVKEKNSTILRLQIGNVQKTNFIEKGISTILIEPQFKAAIKKYFSDVRFDLVLYSTPPITLVSSIEYVKRRDGAKTYLLLKDIFPQNAVDIELISKSGIKGLIYKYFRKQEKKLYDLSDRIGCMSLANQKYIIEHNPEVNPSKIEVCPNSIEVFDKSVDEKTREQIRLKYGIPIDKKVFVYGGNLGKPQGVPFLIDCLKECESIEKAFFLIVGNGTEFDLINQYIETNKPKNVKLMRILPKDDYDSMVGACDVGLIFLDHRFTIPNFPSRLLAYMQAKIPVLACTDPNTDIGKVIEDGKFGWWCESNDYRVFGAQIAEKLEMNLETFGVNAYEYLEREFSVSQSYKIIMGSQ